MVALLDVNVLIALFDPEHVHHEAAHDWFEVRRGDGWATCPITENGFVRVASNPNYPGRRTTIADALERLRRFQTSGYHHFWAASIALCERSRVEPRQIGSHSQLTDVYLLALAVHNDGSLATFDRGISLSSAPGAEPRHLMRIAG